MTNRAAVVVPIVFTVTVLGAVGQSLLKIAINRRAAAFGAATVLALLGDWAFWAGGAVVTAGFLLWLYALGRADLSFATPFLSFGFITSMIAAVLVLKEPVTPLRALGTLVIVAGMLLVARSS